MCITCLYEALILAHLNEVDTNYVHTILDVMKTWHATVTDMHTEDHAIWDAKHKTLYEATSTFGLACKTACIACAKAQDDQQQAVEEGDPKDIIVALLDWDLESTRKVVNAAF